MATREGLLAEFDHEMAATRRLFMCVPDDKLTWKPHERCRSTGDLAAHIIDITTWSRPILDLPRFDLDDAPAPMEVAVSINDLLRRLAGHVSQARALLERSDSELNASWSLLQGGQELFSLPRAAAFRTFVLGHVVHHRGQLSVYLRINDIAVPPIYGPTGDSAARR